MPAGAGHAWATPVEAGGRDACSASHSVPMRELHLQHCACRCVHVLCQRGSELRLQPPELGRAAAVRGKGRTLEGAAELARAAAVRGGECTLEGAAARAAGQRSTQILLGRLRAEQSASLFRADPCRPAALLRRWAAAHNKLFVPSVGPGYKDTKIRPWNSAATRDREGGARYSRWVGRVPGCGRRCPGTCPGNACT